MLYYKHCILGFKFVKTEYLQTKIFIVIIVIIIIIIIILLLLRWWCWWWCIWNQSHRNCGDETKVVNEIYTFAKRRLIKTLALLSLNRKNRLISGGIKRDASDFHGTRVRFPRTFLRVVFTERSKLLKGLELVEISQWKAYFSLGIALFTSLRRVVYQEFW